MGYKWVDEDKIVASPGFGSLTLYESFLPVLLFVLLLLLFQLLLQFSFLVSFVLRICFFL